MKNKVGLVVAIFLLAGFIISFNSSSVYADVKINKKNFAEKKVRKIAKEADVNEDDILQDDEATTVTSIFIMYKHGKKPDTFNLEGIEHFVDTERLELTFDYGDDYEYDIEYVNFNKIYKLTNLKELELHNGDNITSIDLSKFKKIEYVWFSRLASLEKVKFGENKSLEEVRFWWMENLTNLDFSNAKALKKIEIDELVLNKIYFGKNNKTIREIYINVGNYKTKETHIQNLDLTKLKELRSVYIVGLAKIKELDLSNNKKLKNITLVNSKKLKELDLSNNEKLKTIHLESNGINKVKIPKENVIESVFTYKERKLKKFSTKNLNPETLTSLYFWKTELVKLDASKFDNLETIRTWSETEVIYPENNDTYKIIPD